MAEAIVERIQAYLSAHMGAAVQVEDYTPITGGYSRAMSRFHVVGPMGRRGFVMRADPPPGQSILDTDRQYEWDFLRALWDEGSIDIAEPFFFDPTGDELGSPAFISEMIEGDSLHVLANAGTEESNRQYIDRLAGTFASVHTFDTTQLPPSVERPSDWNSYIDACLATWRAAEAAHVEHESFVRSCAAWLDANRPPEAPLSLVHGDMQGPNILVEDSTGRYHLIDWELAHIGDPREDLGWWVLAMGSQPPDIIAQNQDAFYARYRELTGFSEDVINPQTAAYFTVLSSGPVFFNLIRMTARLANGEPMGTSVAYMTNAMPYMHSAWVNSMKASGHWNKD